MTASLGRAPRKGMGCIPQKSCGVLLVPIILIGLAQPVDGFLAHAPGGRADITVPALVAQVNPGIVMPHHLTRIVVAILGAPGAARLMGVRRPKG